MTSETGSQAFHPSPYEEEVKERWGHTEAYRESKRRAASFSQEDWARIKGEQEALEERFAQLLRNGGDPSGPEAMEMAEAHRQHIANFYPCSPAMHVGLAQMYTADPRFAEHYNERQPGLAEFVSAAIQANAKRQASGE